MADLITLRAASGLTADPPALSASTLIMIDCQNTYTRGPLELDGVSPRSIRPRSCSTGRARQASR